MYIKQIIILNVFGSFCKNTFYYVKNLSYKLQINYLTSLLYLN